MTALPPISASAAWKLLFSDTKRSVSPAATAASPSRQMARNRAIWSAVTVRAASRAVSTSSSSRTSSSWSTS